jgi:tetratricopeptide (TPR) repeat protein
MLNEETPAGPTSIRGRSWPRSWILGGLAGVVLLVAALAYWWWPGRNPPPAPLDEEEDPDEVLAVVNPGYVGIEVCAECHGPRAKAVKTSRHYLACMPARGLTTPGFTAGRGRYDPKVPGLHFEMSRSGEEFTFASVQDKSGHEERDSYQVGLVYGWANKRDEMYFSWKDDRLFLLPVAWLSPFNCWGQANDAVSPVEAGPSCMQCHNTWMAHVPGTLNQYRRDSIFLGVTCERCHGPGREHVAYHRQHKGESAHAILHPGTLSRDRLMDVCAQCHGNTRIVGQPFSYRPGQPLDTAYRTVQAKYREDDTTTNQVQYLRESKCFQKNSKMTCITCHDPHVPAAPQTGCMACHTATSCKDQPHQPEAVRGDCVSCHMPQHIWINSHYYTTKDEHYLPVGPRSEHRIGVYPRAKQAVLLSWLRQQPGLLWRAATEHLAAELRGQWLAEAEQLRLVGRFKGAIGALREALQVAPEPTTRQRLQEVIKRQVEVDELYAKLAAVNNSRDQVIQLLTSILLIRPDDARAHGDLGTLYATTGRHAEAIPHLQAVAKCDPFDSSGMVRLAWIALVEGRPQEAASLCAQADKIEHGNPANYFLWGLALAKQKRWADAEQQFRKTLKSEPTHGGANQGLSEALRHQGQAAEALRFARRALRFGNPNDPELLLTLAEAYVAAKRLRDARTTFEQALAAAANNPTLAPAIRARLNELH